jgi:phosphoglycerate dehydrogenase-like enzyme
LKIVAVTGMDLSNIKENLPDELRNKVDFLWFKHTDEAREFLPEADVLVTAGRLDSSIPTSTPKLRWVQTLSAGVDKLPLQAFAQRSIVVTNAKGVHTIQMSEFTISLMLQWVRKTNTFLHNQQRKIWNQQIPVGELHGKSIGIIGAGAIGEAVARKCQAFDMKVIGYNRNGAAPAHFDEIYTGEDGLVTLLQKSDFVVLLLPSTSKTRHFIKKEHLQQMKCSAFLINLARGDVIQEAELIDALEQGHFAGAALDVFDQEPLPEASPLWTMDNVIITPHIAGSSEHYVERAAPIFYHNIKQFLEGQPLMNLVNLQEGY